MVILKLSGGGLFVVQQEELFDTRYHRLHVAWYFSFTLIRWSDLIQRYQWLYAAWSFNFNLRGAS